MKKLEIAIHWLPKVLAMILIIMVLVVSFDNFMWPNLLPALILIIALAVSWKRHLLGAVIFVILDYLYLISMLAKGRPIQQLIVLAIFLALISVCFLISHSRKAKYERALHKINP